MFKLFSKRNKKDSDKPEPSEVTPKANAAGTSKTRKQAPSKSTSTPKATGKDGSKANKSTAVPESKTAASGKTLKSTAKSKPKAVEATKAATTSVKPKPKKPKVSENAPAAILEGFLGLRGPKKMFGSRWKKRHYRLSHDGLWFQEGDAASPEPPLRSFGIELMQDVFIVDDNKFIFQLDFSDRKQPDKQHSEAPAPESLVLRATEEGSFDDWIASLSKSMQAAKEDRTTKGSGSSRKAVAKAQERVRQELAKARARAVRVAEMRRAGGGGGGSSGGGTGKTARGIKKKAGGKLGGTQTDLRVAKELEVARAKAQRRIKAFAAKKKEREAERAKEDALEAGEEEAKAAAVSSPSGVRPQGKRRPASAPLSRKQPTKHPIASSGSTANKGVKGATARGKGKEKEAKDKEEDEEEKTHEVKEEEEESTLHFSSDESLSLEDSEYEDEEDDDGGDDDDDDDDDDDENEEDEEGEEDGASVARRKLMQEKMKVRMAAAKAKAAGNDKEETEKWKVKEEVEGHNEQEAHRIRLEAQKEAARLKKAKEEEQEKEKEREDQRERREKQERAKQQQQQQQQQQKRKAEREAKAAKVALESEERKKKKKEEVAAWRRAKEEKVKALRKAEIEAAKQQETLRRQRLDKLAATAAVKSTFTASSSSSAVSSSLSPPPLVGAKRVALVAASKTDKAKREKAKSTPKPKAKTGKAQPKKIAKKGPKKGSSCDLCYSAKAEVHCLQCSLRLCIQNGCDEDMHRKKTSASHKRTPIAVKAGFTSMMLFCYCCGQQFSFASLPIHHERCPLKRKLLIRDLPEHVRPSVPRPLDLPVPVQGDAKAVFALYNEVAQDTYKRHMCLCPNDGCGRAFEPDRIETHLRGCRMRQR